MQPTTFISHHHQKLKVTVTRANLIKTYQSTQTDRSDKKSISLRNSQETHFNPGEPAGDTHTPQVGD